MAGGDRPQKETSRGAPGLNIRAMLGRPLASLTTNAMAMSAKVHTTLDVLEDAAAAVKKAFKPEDEEELELDQEMAAAVRDSSAPLPRSLT